MKRKLFNPAIYLGSGLRAAACVLAFAPLAMNAAAQDTEAPQLCRTPDGALLRARAMESASLWQGAADQLRLLTVPPEGWLSMPQTAETLYLSALALYGQGDAGCIDALDRFMTLFPQSPDVREACLLKGDWYFFSHNYPQALSAYNDADTSVLGETRRNLYTYRMMLSMLKCGFYDEARPLLDVLAGAGRDYELPVTYYRAYLDYTAGDYDAAYDGFKTVAEALEGSDADGGTTVATRRRRGGRLPRVARPRQEYATEGMEPQYYMVQIDYTRRLYDDVIANGRTLLDKRRVPELLPELWRVMGLSYFKLGNAVQARPLLESYVEAPGITPASDAVYALGAIEYEAGEYGEAAARFSTLTDLRNDLAQGACLYLGQCASREGDENAAAMFYEKAARMNYDPKVGETAMYNYVAAQTRGGKIPFSSSIELFERFLAEYPGSRFAPSVRENLATAYYNERDYARALGSIDRIPNPSGKVMQARQKILYELGMQQIAAGESAAAARSLAGAVDQRGGDPAIAAQAAIWLGDAYYDLGNFRGADEAYARALRSGLKGENAALATYDRAYALYMQDRFKDAAPLFRQASENRSLPAEKRSDARVRLADCLYYTNDFDSAARIYGEAVNAAGGDADYAAWRLALVRGMQGDTAGKLKALADFRRRHAGSRWNPRVLLELGRSQVQLGNSGKGIEAFEDLMKNYPAAPEAREASLALAGLYIDAGQGFRGEETYKRILATWPSSGEADMAHDALKRRYASEGKLDEYVAWLSSVPGARSLDADEMDTLTFEAAEAAYVDDTENVSLLREYLQRYPSGRHVSAALLDLANAEDAMGNYDKALGYIDTLLGRDAASDQGIEALIVKGEILEAHYPGRRREALETWRALERAGGADLAPEAWSGIMRTTESEKERVEYARRLRQTGGLTAEQAEEARLYEAMGSLKGSGAEAAERELELMARNPASLSGAKAAVVLGEHYLATKRAGKAVTLLSEFTDTGSPHSYWLARGFIALADAYTATGQKYLAAEYLKSLRDNYPGAEPDIRDGIKRRLEKL